MDDNNWGQVPKETQVLDMKFPPAPEHKKKRKHILCMLFGHKYFDKELEGGVFEPTCKRCGHERDVYPPKKKPKENEQTTKKVNKSEKK